MFTGAVSWVVSWSLMLVIGLVATLALVGCETAAGPRAAPSLATEPASAPAADLPPRGEQALADRTRALADRLNSQISDIAEAQARSTPPDPIDGSLDPFAGAPPAVRSANPAPPAPRVPAEMSPPGAPEVDWLGSGDNAPPAARAASPAAAPAAEVTVLPVVLPAPEPSSLSRDQLLAAIMDQLRASDDPALAQAVTAAALSLAHPGRKIDPRLLDPLKPMQREAVERLHQLFLNIHDQATAASQTDGQSLPGGAVASGGGGFDRKTLDRALADAFGSMPVTIVHADLCRSVSGYGIYEPLAGHNFLAGQANRAIVYVEVEDFDTQAADQDQREVRLTQELIVYKEDDGLAVWRHEPTDIVDVSRNRRRDFYVVQMITLPARLSAGRYRLKIRITDQHGDSVDETTLRVNVVADPSLLSDR
ncbi:MAG: hypothetical protein AAGG38_14295 [Planctomycetota bacterium]